VSNSNDSLKKVQKERDDSITKLKRDSIEFVKRRNIEESKKRFEILKKNFVFKEDEFKNIGWYIHKSQTVSNSWNRKCLKTHINSDGYIYLEDQYYSDDWIFHSRIEVKIGGEIFRSEDIPTYSEYNKTENSSGSVWENISYIDGQDNGIIKCISENVDQEIKVRFIGKQYYSDFVLY
jgi:hypothetical protein